MPAKYTLVNLAKNQPLVAEWTAAKEKALTEPKDLRPAMRTLGKISWRTSAIESQGTLSEWISARERQLLNEKLASASASANGELAVSLSLARCKRC